MTKTLGRIFGLLLIITGVQACNNAPADAETEETAGDDLFYPSPEGHINDFEEILSPIEESRLDSSVKWFSIQTGQEIAVLSNDTFPTGDPLTYATEVGNRWGVGDKDKNDGIVLFVSAHKRITAIAVGDGIRETYTDSACKYIIDNKMIPFFSRGAYYLGIEEGLRHLRSIDSAAVADTL